MEIHKTSEFIEWWSRPFISQPSGNAVTRDFSMVCFIVSFRGRISNLSESYQAWSRQYAKWRKDVVLTEEDEEKYCQYFKRYNTITDQELGNSQTLNIMPAV